MKSVNIKKRLAQKTSFLIVGESYRIDPFYGSPEVLLVCASKTGFEFFDESLVIGHIIDASHPLGL